MCTWIEFEAKAPDFAEAARRLFIGSDGVAIGFLATASRRDEPHVSPVCPIFSAHGLHLSAVGSTPNVSDLRANPHFTLHAFLGPNDEEMQLRGLATEVTSAVERAAVHAAIRFGSFDHAHPIFHLEIRSALWVFWVNAGRPDTSAVRRKWRDPRSGS